MNRTSHLRSRRDTFGQRSKSEPKSLALLVNVVLARYGLLPISETQSPVPKQSMHKPATARQMELFPRA